MKLYDPIQGIKLWLLNPYLHLAMAAGWALLHIMKLPHDSTEYKTYSEATESISQVFFVEHCIFTVLLFAYSYLNRRSKFAPVIKKVFELMCIFCYMFTSILMLSRILKLQAWCKASIESIDSLD